MWLQVNEGGYWTFAQKMIRHILSRAEIVPGMVVEHVKHPEYGTGIAYLSSDVLRIRWAQYEYCVGYPRSALRIVHIPPEMLAKLADGSK